MALKDFLLKMLSPENRIKTIIIGAVAVILLCTLVAVLLLSGGKDNTPAAVSSVPSVVSSCEAAVSSEPEPEPELKPLTVTSPKTQNLTVTEPDFLISGDSDKSIPLYLNGKEIERDENGAFSLSHTLSVGKNTFTFKYGETETTYTVTYKYIIINEYSPSASATFPSGSTLSVSVKARAGAAVKATFNGQTLTLTRSFSQGDDEAENTDSNTFVNYSGSFSLPKDNVTDKNLGKVTFTATHGGISESYSSGNITVQKSSLINNSDPSVTPQGGIYTDVGSGLIATIVKFNAETFNGDTTDDMSRPTNNYLPEGTVDYCAEGLVTNGSNSYVLLRCGKRVYLETNPGTSYEATVVTQTLGTLPETNQLSLNEFKNDGQYTVLSLNTAWNAPFYFDILNQSYENPSQQKYSFSNVTFSYIDITFCYADELAGEFAIEEGHPLFKSAEVIKNKNDYTLRLKLNKTGAFYGWDCYYDDAGRLTFKFLNPRQIEEEGTLKGARIFLDVGHGGKDGGATGLNYTNREAVCNLALANKVKTRLESLGATVIMSRTGDTYISPPERQEALRAANADFCLAIHHDASSSPSQNGFGAFHYTQYSKTAADFIKAQTDATDVYNKEWPVRFHYYYVARMPFCPVVLTENGYLTNTTDYENAIDDTSTDQKAAALVQGIVDYFGSIQPA